MIRTILPLFALPLAASVPALASENIPVSQFSDMELRGGGEVLVRKGPLQRVTIVEGSSQFTAIRVLGRGRLRIDACNASCPHTYRLKIIVESPTVPALAVEGGGKITATEGFGRQRQLTVAVNGGGAIDATALAADAATAAVHGGGEIKLRALRVLTAAVNGGGTIRYWGDPEVTSAISGGGTVRRGR